VGASIRQRSLDDEVSGMIYVMHNVPIVGGNALYRLNRQRYTIEHEVGHLEGIVTVTGGRQWLGSG
jgi:Zn-dependent peptidase ImmA (M78 family)